MRRRLEDMEAKLRQPPPPQPDLTQVIRDLATTMAESQRRQEENTARLQEAILSKKKLKTVLVERDGDEASSTTVSAQ